MESESPDLVGAGDFIFLPDPILSALFRGLFYVITHAQKCTQAKNKGMHIHSKRNNIGIYYDGSVISALKVG